MRTKCIITPEKAHNITNCKSCSKFRKPLFSWFVPAYCSEEGRIVESVYEVISGAFSLNIYCETVLYPIPKWCPLPEASNKE